MRLIATCPEETKDALVQELRALGAENLEPGFRAVAFDASDALFYTLHLELRTASRILRVIKEVPAHTPAMLFSQARRIRWHELFDVQHGFMVESLGGESGRGGMPPKQILTQVREAIRDVFERDQGRAPKVDVEEPKVVVVAHLVRGRCTLSLDTSGKSLHKRGYRESGHPGPIKETLAAALLELAGYDGTQPFMDPMCGSGTIAIEAAMIAVKKAPQIHRKRGEFYFEWHKGFDRELWRETQERARAQKLDQAPAPIVASDVNDKYVAMARKSALEARVEKFMTFATQRFQDATPPGEHGILVSNLPYGERIHTSEGSLETLYAEIGDTLKQRFSGWRAGLLVADDAPHKHIGLRASRRVPIMNGSIPCKLLLYDLYAGSRR